MRSAVIVGSIAITTEYWEEQQQDGTRETGCRVELRRFVETAPPSPPPASRRDAVYWSIADHLWRADLFTTVGGPGPYDAAHFHPTFTGLVPCDRATDPALVSDPYGWMEGRLRDVPGMLVDAGHDDLAAGVDAAAMDQAMPAVLATIRTCLAFRP
jgi:hypothetical protein